MLLETSCVEALAIPLVCPTAEWESWLDPADKSTSVSTPAPTLAVLPKSNELPSIFSALLRI